MTVFGELIITANKFTEGILKSPLTIVDGIIGRLHGGKFVEHYWFGGTEKALAYIAIAVALSAKAPFKLVILDEFGRLDEENKWRVLRRLADMQISGVIDQFVIAGTELPELGGNRIIPGLRIIKVK